MNRQKLLYGTAAIALAIVVAVTGLLNSNSGPPPLTDAALASLSPSAENAPASPDAASSTTRPDSAETPVARKPDPKIEPVDPEKYSAGPKLAWEKDIINLASRLDVPDEAKVKQLLSKMNTLPPDGKVLAMEYATRMIPDEKYIHYRPILFGLVTSPELRETVMLDVLTRGEQVRMPTLVEMLRQPTNPTKEEIREILVAYLDTDYGEDINGWDRAVKKFLLDNPDL